MATTGRTGCRRWDEQRWLVDVAIRTDGMEWDQPRIGYTLRPAGPEAKFDFAWVADRVRKYDDITPVSAVAARRREALAKEAEAAGRTVAAREQHWVASALWLTAAWPIFETTPELVEYNDRKNACYAKWGQFATHHVERVEIPFGDAILPAWFHLPPGYDGGRVPAVLACGGMDAFKEIQISMYGDKLLERGFAVLVVDGPGRGESPILGNYVTERNWIDAGQLLVDWLAAREEVDDDRMVAWGLSFGSFWMTQVAATQPRLKSWAVGLVCHEPGAYTIFEKASRPSRRGTCGWRGSPTRRSSTAWRPSWT